MELRRSCYLIAAPADLPSGRVLVVTLLYISSDDCSVESKLEDTKHGLMSFVRSKSISRYVPYMEKSYGAFVAGYCHFTFPCACHVLAVKMQNAFEIGTTLHEEAVSFTLSVKSYTNLKKKHCALLQPG